MTGPELIDLGREAIFVVLKATAPMMGVAMAVGLTIALFQALTQIQEMTLTFVPKIIAVFLTMLLSLSYIGQLMWALMESIVGRIMSG